MLKLALLGKDVSKSDSRKMHSFILQGMGRACEYELISVPAEEFASAAKACLAERDGFNVTIPYKLEIIPYLTSLEGDAKTFGAVNTVKNGAGYNTDGAGFLLMLENGGVRVVGKKVLVLGAGGAGRSVVKKLIDAGAFVSVFDVNAQNVQNVFEEFGALTPLKELAPNDYYMIVNATGVGMHKSEGVSPAGEEILSRCEVACDLIYYPRKSEFLRIAEGLGKRILNGEGMLFYQAYFADCIYLGKPADPAEAKALFERYLETKEK